MQNWLSRLLSALCALTVFGMLGSFLISPLETIKRIGAPFMVLPAAFGLIPSIAPTDVQAISLAHKSPKIMITRPGQYAVYANENSVLTRANLLEATDTTWITAHSVPPGDETPGVNIVRGALPYDPIAVPGRPIATFTLTRPGTYTLAYPTQSGTVYFAPDPTTGRESVIVSAFIAQIIGVFVIGVIAFWPRIRRYRLQQQQLTAKLVQKRAHAEAFWQRRAREQENANQDKNKENTNLE